MKITVLWLMFVIPAILASVNSTASAQYVLNTLASFNQATGNAAYRGGQQLMIDSQGNLVGLTQIDGAYNSGSVFEIAAGTHNLTTLVSCNPATNGSSPSSLAADAAGNVYVSCFSPGGSIFKLSAGAYAFNSFVSFPDSGVNTTGVDPGGLRFDAAGNMYGFTYIGGPQGGGTIFQILAGTSAINTLNSFDRLKGELYGPFGLTADANGNLYGPTQNPNAGGVFELSAGTNTLSTLANFITFDNPGNGFAELTADSHGHLYGTMYAASTTVLGTVYMIDTVTHVMHIVYSFDGGVNGGHPWGGLVMDANGTLYGTTYSGGLNGQGTVFKLNPETQKLTTLFAFNGSNGSQPTNLIMDASGNLYGVTAAGGANNFGTVFELSPVPEPPALILAGCGLLAMIATVSERNR
jgi:uncharacterized repeat protein (TIGR03803 family)